MPEEIGHSLPSSANARTTWQCSSAGASDGLRGLQGAGGKMSRSLEARHHGEKMA